MTGVHFVRMLRKYILPEIQHHHGHRGRIIMDNDSKHKAKYTQTELNEDGYSLVSFHHSHQTSIPLRRCGPDWMQLSLKTHQNHSIS